MDKNIFFVKIDKKKDLKHFLPFDPTKFCFFGVKKGQKNITKLSIRTEARTRDLSRVRRAS